MTNLFLRVLALLVIIGFAVGPASIDAQTTFGVGAGQSTSGAQSDKASTGPVPRLPNGKPDFSGVWDHPYVPDMSITARNPAIQKGAGELPYSQAGLDNIKNYNPERDGDYTGMCMPYGLTRSMNAPYPIQIMQNDKVVAFMFEVSTWFHVAQFADDHPKNLDPLWFGNSIAKWDGDTLIIDTIGFNGYTRLDTKGNPHSDKLHLTQTFKHIDAGHVAYKMTIDDPVNYTKPWSNERTMTLSNGPLFEYSCEENNRGLWEGRIKIWTPPNAEPPRIPKK
jgi:hypothetical protein